MIVAARTATVQYSIWKNPDEATFRRNLVALADISDEVPGERKSYYNNKSSPPTRPPSPSERALLIEDEKRLANDIAFLVAASEGAGAVTAVALEEKIEPRSLTIRLAANAQIPECVLEQVRAILTLLYIPQLSCLTNLFPLVVKLNRDRIHARLRSKHWAVPSYMGQGARNSARPLHESLRAHTPHLENDLHYPQISKMLVSLCNEYERVETDLDDMDQDVRRLQSAIKMSFDMFRTMEMCTNDTALQPSNSTSLRLGSALANRDVQQVYKLGRYWGLCQFLTKAARRYPALFCRASLEHIRPYTNTRSPISLSTLRNPNKDRVKCFVHAEIQLITFYGLSKNRGSLDPRWLGVSKSACFLCDLFIKAHGQFWVSHTHGRLYDQWTVPDLAEFGSTQRNDYRRIIKEINQACIHRLKAIQAIPRHKRSHLKFPSTSKYSLLEHEPLSTIANSSIASISEAGVAVDAAESALSHQVRTGTPRPHGSSQFLEREQSSHTTDTPSMQYLENTIDNPIIESDRQEEVLTAQLSSRSTIDLPGSPVEQGITPHSPINITASGLRLLFEIGQPRTGNIRVSIPNGKSAILDRVIDVNAMAPGEAVELYQDDPAGTIQFDIGGMTEQLIRVGLSWCLDQTTKEDSSVN
ncbi:MAG: hypothetical protein Q9186_001990 [Xanthomendoza sp. 1 TL-2023]